MPSLLAAIAFVALPAGSVNLGKQRANAMRHLPDVAFSGVIEVKFKQGEQLVLGPQTIQLGTKTVIDTDALVGNNRGVFLPQTLFFQRSQDATEAKKHRTIAQLRCNCDVPDMSGYVRIDTKTTSLKDAYLLIDRLNSLAEVEIAYPVMKPALPASPDFFDDELHLLTAPEGVDAIYTLNIPEARGKGIKVGDVEGGWNLGHEDLPACTDYSEYPGVSSDRMTTDHGTAVLGEIFGVPNSFGVTGIAPEATCQVASAHTKVSGQWDWNIAKAMLRHASHMTAGDVVLLEVHGPGPHTTNENYQYQVGFVPGEWEEAVWDATDTLTKQGIIVVAAAGNGGEDLDDPVYQGWFSPQTHHSGAIMVGAGAGSQSPIPNKRLSFSNYGARVNVHAWGEQVTTTGYGDAYNPTLLKEYTFQFAGTSSASPIVTASVAVINGYLKAMKKPVLKAADMSTLLESTGTPQAGGTSQKIGPLPNLKAALAALEICGDGKKAPAEVCDDGNEVDGDGCSADCMSDESCGNGVLDTSVGEVCDDKNTKAGDGCRADCMGKELCGDGQLDAAKQEICDDGNKNDGDGCTADCKGKEVCGDGIIDVAKGEVCDDDNTSAGDGCSKDCKSDESCGNGIIDVAADEECDGEDDCDWMCKTIVKQTQQSSSSSSSGGTQPKATGPAPGSNNEATTSTTGCSSSGAPWPLVIALGLLIGRRRRTAS